MKRKQYVPNPIGSSLVIRKDIEPEKVGIILLPKKETGMMGTVIAVGDQVRDVKTGSKVVYKAMTAMDSETLTKQYFLLKRRDILALVS